MMNILTYNNLFMQLRLRRWLRYLCVLPLLLLLHGSDNVAGEKRRDRRAGRDRGFLHGSKQKSAGIHDGFAILFHFDNPACKDSSTQTSTSALSLPKYMMEAIEQLLRFEDFAYSTRNHNTGAASGAEAAEAEVTLILITNAKACGIHSLKPSTWPSELDLNRRVLIVDSEVLDRAPDVLAFRDAVTKSTSYLVDNNATKDAQSSDTAALYFSSMQRFFYISVLLQHQQRPSQSSGTGAGTGAGADSESLTTQDWRSVDGRPVPHIRQCLLIESDNLMYTDTAHILPYLQHFYSNLAGVVQSNVHFTASIFWVAKYAAIKHLTDFILEVYTTPSEFLAYTTYISRFVSKRVKHGHAPLNAEGNGIPLFAVNEMTLLHYYHHLYRDQQDILKRPLLQSLPLFVTKDGITGQRKHGNWKAYVGIPVWERWDEGMVKDTVEKSKSALFLNHTFVAAGEEAVVGADIARGVFDPGSWGQYLGGTYALQRAPGFIDMSHIIGKAMVKSACSVKIRCVCMKREREKRKSGVDGGNAVTDKDNSASHSDAGIGTDIVSAGIGIHKDIFTGTKPSQQDLHMHITSRRPHSFKSWTPELQSSLSGLPVSALPSSSEVQQRLSPLTEFMNEALQNITYSNHGNGFTGPFIRCCAGKVDQYGEETSCGQWGRLWNLHVHSKNTLPFLSKKCNC